MPMTPVSGQPQMIYTNRASEFVFKGIKDLTKSGLSVGEKSVLWLYEKVRLEKSKVRYSFSINIDIEYNYGSFSKNYREQKLPLILMSLM